MCDVRRNELVWGEYGLDRIVQAVEVTHDLMIFDTRSDPVTPELVFPAERHRPGCRRGLDVVCAAIERRPVCLRWNRQGRTNLDRYVDAIKGSILAGRVRWLRLRAAWGENRSLLKGRRLD
jgi:hypothetical protein